MSFVYLALVKKEDTTRYVVFTTIDKACSYIEKQTEKYISSCGDGTLKLSDFSVKLQPLNVIKMFSSNSYWTLTELVNIHDEKFACYMQRLHMDSTD